VDDKISNTIIICNIVMPMGIGYTTTSYSLWVSEVDGIKVKIWNALT